MTSVSVRITLGFSALVTVTTAVLLLLGGWLLSRQMVRGIELLNEAEFHELEERLDAPGAQLDAAAIRDRIDAHMVLDASLYYAQVHRPDGTVLYRSQNLGEAILPMAMRVGEQHWTSTVPPFGQMHISEFITGDLHVQIASLLDPTRRLLRQYVSVSVLLLGFAAAGSLVLGTGFAHFTLQPVRAITATASRIGADNLSERIPVRGSGDEINQLSQLLNQTFDRLETAFQQVRRFTADASHELKTPLALIRLNAERLRAQVAADPAAVSSVEDLLEEVSRLQQIIETLLFLSKAESGALAVSRREVAAERFIADFAGDAAVLGEDAGVRFLVGRSDPGTVRIEANLIRQLLLNVVSNAIGVSPAGGRVQLDSVVADGVWRLVVTDEGPGLSPDQLARIFERFVRFERADGAPRRGHGLGLAICRSIAGLHGGEIRAERRPDQPGLQITVNLPLTP